MRTIIHVVFLSIIFITGVCQAMEKGSGKTPDGAPYALQSAVSKEEPTYKFITVDEKEIASPNKEIFELLRDGSQTVKNSLEYRPSDEANLLYLPIDEQQTQKLLEYLDHKKPPKSNEELLELLSTLEPLDPCLDSNKQKTALYKHYKGLFSTIREKLLEPDIENFFNRQEHCLSLLGNHNLREKIARKITKQLRRQSFVLLSAGNQRFIFDRKGTLIGKTTNAWRIFTMSASPGTLCYLYDSSFFKTSLFQKNPSLQKEYPDIDEVTVQLPEKKEEKYFVLHHLRKSKSDGRGTIYSCENQTVCRHDTALQQILEYPCLHEIQAISLSPNKSKLAIIQEQKIEILDAKTLDLIYNHDYALPERAHSHHNYFKVKWLANDEEYVAKDGQDCFLHNLTTKSKTACVSSFFAKHMRDILIREGIAFTLFDTKNAILKVLRYKTTQELLTSTENQWSSITLNPAIKLYRQGEIYMRLQSCPPQNLRDAYSLKAFADESLALMCRDGIEIIGRLKLLYLLQYNKEIPEMISFLDELVDTQNRQPNDPQQSIVEIKEQKSEKQLSQPPTAELQEKISPSDELSKPAEKNSFFKKSLLFGTFGLWTSAATGYLIHTNHLLDGFRAWMTKKFA